MIKLRLPQGTGILHAAALGAVALLLLKLLGLMTDTSPAPAVAPAASLSEGVTQTIARARDSAVERPVDEIAYRPIVRARDPDALDPDTTGSVKEPAKPDTAKPDPAKSDPAKPDAAKPPPGKTAGRTAAPPANGAMPADRGKAPVLDGIRPQSPAERALLERLGERREELDGRARELEMRERLLNSAERKLEGRIEELRGLEEKGGDPAVKAQQTEQAALKNVVIMYEAMKPKDAARVFDRLPHDVLVPVVLQMNPRKMAEVLAAMSPESAEKLTIALATRGRSAEVRAPAGGMMPANELPAMDPTPVPRR
jgi:flagellar motility protein MotE (MotC chaperone)